MTKSASEKRRRFRVLTDRPLIWTPVELIEAREFFHGRAVDISASGMAFISDRPIFVGHRVAVLLQSEAPPLQFAGRARVIRCRERDGEYVCAIQFEGLSDETQAAMTRFVLAEAKRLGQGMSIASEARWDGWAGRAAAAAVAASVKHYAPGAEEAQPEPEPAAEEPQPLEEPEAEAEPEAEPEAAEASEPVAAQPAETGEAPVETLEYD